MRKLLLLMICMTLYPQVYAQSWSVPGSVVAGGNGPGGGDNQFGSTSDIYVTSDGIIYVSDGSNHRVQKWIPGQAAGVTVAGGNGQGSAANALSFPGGIWLDEADNTLYVVDALNARVQKWAEGATEGVTVAGGNGWGSGLNQLYLPNGIFKKGNELYIYDGNARVVRWSLGDSEGVVVAGGNGFGSASNQLMAPEMTGFLYVDEQDNVYVTEYSGDKVSRWAPGATEGVIVADITDTGISNVRVSGITVLDDNRMILTYSQQAQNSVTLWSDGVFVTNIVPTGSGDLSQPISVRADANANLYVLDAQQRVKRYGLSQYLGIATVSGGVSQVAVDATLALTATVLPADLSPEVTWSVESGEAYGSVDANGVVTGLAVGTVVVRATSVAIPTLFDTHTVTVVQAGVPCELSVTTTTEVVACAGSSVTLTAVPNNPDAVITWYATAEASVALATGSEYAVDGLTGSVSYWVRASLTGETCVSELQEVQITVTTVAAPEAISEQSVTEGATLADLEVSATGLLTWYADAALTTILPETTALVNGTTYYVTQTLEGCQSSATPIAVEVSLGMAQFEGASARIYPNPVERYLRIEAVAEIKNVEIYNLLGQRVMGSSKSEIDMSNLKAGIYNVRIVFEGGGVTNKKIVKK